jgi:predicted DNA-binding ribbon-helix-helix protein
VRAIALVIEFTHVRISTLNLSSLLRVCVRVCSTYSHNSSLSSARDPSFFLERG